MSDVLVALPAVAAASVPSGCRGLAATGTAGFDSRQRGCCQVPADYN